MNMQNFLGLLFAMNAQTRRRAQPRCDVYLQVWSPRGDLAVEMVYGNTFFTPTFFPFLNS